MSLRPARSAALAAALVLLAGIAWAGVVLLRDGGHAAVPGVVPPGAFVADVSPRGEQCQPLPAVAEPAMQATLTLGTYSRPSVPVEVVVRSGERQLATSGRVVARNGVATFTLRPELRPVDGPVLVCVRNQGRGRVAIAGVSYPPPAGVKEPGRALSIRLTGRPQSHLSRAALTLDRYSAARAGDLGGWVLLVALGLFVVVALGAVRVVVAQARTADHLDGSGGAGGPR